MDRKLYERVQNWIDAHFDEIIADLTDLVAIPSVAVYDEPGYPYGKNCKDVLDAFLAKAASYGFVTENCGDRCGTVTLRAGKTGEDEICLWCHLDVVPAGDGWALTEPFKAVIKDGYLIGRGGGDNKGPAVGVMYVLRCLEELGLPTKHGVRLCVGCDEEHGMSDVMYYAENYPAAALNMIADGGFPVGYGEKGIFEANLVSKDTVSAIRCIKAGMASNIVPDEAYMEMTGTAEPFETEWAKVTSENGVTRIFARGTTRHSAHPQGATNAIHEMTKAALQTNLLAGKEKDLLSFFTRVNDDAFGTELGIVSSDDISGDTTCAGTMAGIKDGHPYLHVNIRHAIKADAEQLLKSMREACEKNNCDLDLLQNNGPNYYDPSNPVVDALTDVYNSIMGLETKPNVMAGGTYARKLPNAFTFGIGGMPAPETALFAPGHGGAHQRDEGLYLENYRKALGILAMGILEADGFIK